MGTYRGSKKIRYLTTIWNPDINPLLVCKDKYKNYSDYAGKLTKMPGHKTQIKKTWKWLMGRDGNHLAAHSSETDLSIQYKRTGKIVNVNCCAIFKHIFPVEMFIIKSWDEKRSQLWANYVL